MHDKMSEIRLWISVWNNGNFADVRRLLRLIVTPSGILAGSSRNGPRFLNSKARSVKRTETCRTRVSQRGLQRRKNRADRFAPRARVFHWGDRVHPSSLASHSKFRSASAFFFPFSFFNIHLTAVVRNACPFTQRDRSPFLRGIEATEKKTQEWWKFDRT